jgi:aromatic ring-opening dioxygenase catalytic subunit (LigB family)
MNNSRRDFLKKTITTAAAIPVMGASTGLFANSFNKNEWEKQSDKELLKSFEKWVDEYLVEIQKEKAQPQEFKNNRALVDLPAQMEEMMPLFKARFENQEFMKSYLQISRKLTKEIDPGF